MLRTIKFRQLIFISFLTLSLVIVGCSDDDDKVTTPTVDEGFQAEASDFADFQTWEQIDYTIYPANENTLGGQHMANDPMVARMRYKNATTNLLDGEYDRGSIIVKETFMWTDGVKEPVEMGAFLAMTKRSGDFNSENGGWEYFDLGADGSDIAGRGADLMGGACNQCHTAATGNLGTNFIFDHPSEYAVPEGGEFDVFSNPTSWEMIDSTFGPDPALGPAHGGGDLHRVTYRWQPGAMYSDGQFPVGTVLMKEMYDLDDNNEKTGVVWTGMVKRGGDFNPTYGNWEWFMMNPGTQEVLVRGAVDGNGDPLGCNGCHSAAAGSGGGDFVFNHEGLGF